MLSLPSELHKPGDKRHLTWNSRNAVQHALALWHNIKTQKRGFYRKMKYLKGEHLRFAKAECFRYVKIALVEATPYGRPEATSRL